LRLWQYLANSSLWIDEAALARNIIDRPVMALLAGLEDAQVAPPAFLLVEKAVVAVAGSSEFALRFFPLLCGLVALVVFARLAKGLLEGWAVPFAVGLFALGTPLVYFPSQVKQYSTDTAAALVVLAAAVWFAREPSNRRRALALAAVGAIAPWFSQPTSFVVAAAAISLTVQHVWRRSNQSLSTVLTVLIPWGISGAAASLIALRAVSPTDREYFQWYWSVGFWPFPPHSVRDLLWPLNQLTLAFGTFVSGPLRTNGGLNYPWSFLFVIVMFVGYVALGKRRPDVVLFLVLPPLLALGASALNVYPFTGRLLVYLAPTFLLAVAAGAQQLANLPAGLQFATPVLLAVLVGSPLYTAATTLPPDRVEHMRPIMSKLAGEMASRDALYVYYGAAEAFYYYAPRFGMPTGEVAVGRCSLARPRAYLEQIDRFRGRSRVWVLATQVSRWTNDLEMLTAYLDTIGRRTSTVVVPATQNVPSLGVYLFLYDLSDPGRLATASAGTFPASKGVSDEDLAKWGCYGVVTPSRGL